MTLQQRDKRALLILFIAVVGVLVWYAAGSDQTAVPIVHGSNSVDQSERRLAKARETAAAVPAKEEVLEDLTEALRSREAGVIQADTAAQAQERILQIVRRLAREQNPPVEVRGVEIGQIQSYGSGYGEAQVSVHLTCHLEQLLNLMAGLTQQPEAIATTELRVMAQGEKMVAARVVVSGLVAKNLVPERKELRAF
jgi:hypothetical protein